MYPFTGKPSDSAARFFYDAPTHSVAFLHNGNEWAGLTMVLDNNPDSYAETLLTNSVGTSMMSVAYDQLVWQNDRFGSWIICKNYEVANQLLWWDTVSTKGIDESQCSKVQLLIEYL